MEKKLQKPRNFAKEVTIKGLIIVGMMILLLIPVLMLQNMVSERESRKKETVDGISSSWSSSQTLCGPTLTVPFIEEVKDDKGKISFVMTNYTIAPEKLDIRAELTPVIKRLGIYEAILYEGVIDISGEFAPLGERVAGAGRPYLSKAFLSMELSDLRGLSNELVFTFNGKEYATGLGSGGREYYDYSNYKTVYMKDLIIKPETDGLDKPTAFSCRMELKGSEGIYFVPIGKTTNVEVTGSWPHPSFTGSFLPSHDIGKDGFTAQWNILHYNRNIPDVWTYETFSLDHTSFGVKLVAGADEYQQNERAMKYAMLFIVLTFVVFFFVEVLTYKRIHPIQYLLVAAALIIFYTLLLSLSEILGFGWAYLVSSAATVGLVTLYTATIFRNGKQTLLMSLILAGLYAYLYFILQLENYTLLVGSVGLFVILAAIMYVSRRVNWYRTEE